MTDIVKRDVGRPTVFTNELLNKLEEAFALGCSDKEACLLANISPASLYNYQNDNQEFLERKNQLKEEPILKARRTVVNNLSDVDTAQWYLERKAKGEFAERHENINVEIPVPLLENLKK